MKAMVAQEVCVVSLDRKNITLKETEPISNILKVINSSSDENFNFRLIVSHPNNWKFLGDKNFIYSLAPLDSIFLPIRLIPSTSFKGDTKYFINCFVEDADIDIAVNSASFFISKDLLHSWKISSNPSLKLYLKNKQNEIKFKYQILNEGTEDEEIIADVFSLTKDKITFIDSLGKPIKKLKYILPLKPGEDTILDLNVSLTERLRNYSFIPNSGPDLNNKVQKYFVNIDTKQSIYFETKQKVSAFTEIKHLPNSIKEHQFSKKVYPINWFFQVSNINNRPITNNILYGSFFLKDGGQLLFQNQLFLGGGINFSYRSIFFNTSYYNGKRNLFVRSGLLGNGLIAGQGISASYKFNNVFTLGATVVAAPSLVNTKGFGFSLITQLKPSKKLNLTSSYSFGVLDSNRTFQNFFRSSIGYVINQKSSVFVGGSFFTYNSTNPNRPASSIGYNTSAGYSIRYLKRFSTNLSLSLQSPSRGAVGFTGIGTRIVNHSSSFKLNPKWSFVLNNNYNRIDSISPIQQEFENLVNRLDIRGEILGRPFRPSLLYRISRYQGGLYMLQAIQYNFSNTNNNTGLMQSYFFQLGRQGGIRDIRNIYYSINYYASYRVWRLLATYSRGSIGTFYNTSTINTPFDFLHNILVNFSNQYQFLNPRWLLENTISLRSSYLNSITLNPRIYYFTKTGFTLMLQPGLYWSKRKNTSLIGQMNENFAPVANYGTFINFSLRKVLAFSKPKDEKVYSSLKFITFFDHNGNYKIDEGESTIENVVIQIGNHELLTDENGEAELINAFKDSTYDLNIFSLEDLRDYFPNYFKSVNTIKDSTILIPFVKGVTVFGEIYIDQDKYQKEFQSNFDLSNLRVSAFNGLDVHTLTDSKGKFEMYVPYGKYTISIQNQILGNKFKALENNFKVDLDGSTQRVFVSFYLVEKRKKITLKKF